eukprot:795555-Pleurochrysis_carterae.AAC.1
MNLAKHVAESARAHVGGYARACERPPPHACRVRMRARSSRIAHNKERLAVVEDVEELGQPLGLLPAHARREQLEQLHLPRGERQRGG